MRQGKGRSDRLTVTIGPTVKIALEHLAEKNGIGVATQASVTLRQALDRTIQSGDVQSKLAAHRLGRTTEEWRREESADYQTDYTVAKIEKRI